MKREICLRSVLFIVNIYKTMFRGTQCIEEGGSTFAKAKMLVQKYMLDNLLV